MAWWTDSGACSSRSDSRTCSRPSRSRIVVFSDVNLRKRMSSGGMGARGRSSRYSRSKISVRAVDTLDPRLTCGAGPDEGADTLCQRAKTPSLNRLTSVRLPLQQARPPDPPEALTPGLQAWASQEPPELP